MFRSVLMCLGVAVFLLSAACKPIECKPDGGCPTEYVCDTEKNTCKFVHIDAGSLMLTDEERTVPGDSQHCGFFYPSSTTTCSYDYPYACGGSCCPADHYYHCPRSCHRTQQEALNECGSYCMTCAAAPVIR